MATYDTPTTKYTLPRLDGSSDISDVDEGIAALADAVDANMAGYAEGTLASLPAVGRSGRFYRTTDTGQVFLDTGAAWIEIGVAPWVPGDLKATWLTAAPSGWLICDGSAVSRTTYAALFAAIGASAGAGNGTTTFNVPDYRGRVFVMPDGSAGRLASNDARGQAGGEETHALSVAEMPAHTHPGSVGNVSTVGTNPDGTVAHMGDLAGSVQYSQALSIASQGGGGAHQNMPPFLTGGAVLIKT